MKRTKEELLAYYRKIRPCGGHAGEFGLGYELGQKDARKETEVYYATVTGTQGIDAQGYLTCKGRRLSVIDRDGNEHFIKAGKE